MVSGSHSVGQGSLFGEPVAPDRGPVGPAPPAEELLRLARELPAHVRFGTSSWSFPGWRGIVYDRAADATRLAREGLAAYARHPLLRAVGIDRTFYAPLPAADLAAYAACVPDTFRFLVKAPGALTSPVVRDGAGRPTRANPAFLDAGLAAVESVAPFVEGLGTKGGALVFQFSPLGRAVTAEPARFAARLHGFLEALPRGPCYAVELRDRELYGTDYLDALAAAGAVHCYNVHPRMPSVAEQRARAGRRLEGPLVARWMLHGGLDYARAVERYEPFTRIVDEDPRSREALARLCLEVLPTLRPILVVANNKAEGSAPLSVFGLARAVLRLRAAGDSS